MLYNYNMERIKTVSTEIPLKVKQANEKYLLNKKHELEECIEDMKESYAFEISLKKALKIILDKPLYFSFGKYKDRIVQDILQQDEDYCIWFRDNVRGKNFEDLQIIDYLVKKLNNDDYWLGSPQVELENLIKQYNLKIKSLSKNYILEEFSYTTKSSGYNSSDFNGRYMSDWEEQMYEIYDYGDLC